MMGGPVILSYLQYQNVSRLIDQDKIGNYVVVICMALLCAAYQSLIEQCTHSANSCNQSVTNRRLVKIGHIYETLKLFIFSVRARANPFLDMVGKAMSTATF